MESSSAARAAGSTWRASRRRARVSPRDCADAALRETWEALGSAGCLSQADADAIVAAAKPRALAALGRGGESPEALPVAARLVEPAEQRGGSLIPAWPERRPDESVVIEFVADWGVMLAAWRS